jgi:hypothetical protein
LLDQASGFDVDPDYGPYESIHEAYAAADERLPSGEPILLRIAKGKDHNLPSDLNVSPGRALAIHNKIPELSRGNMGGGAITRITGSDIVLPSNDGTGRKALQISNVTLNGPDIRGNSNWAIHLNEIGLWENRIFRTHGTNGCTLALSGCYANNGSLRVLDSDAAPGGADGYVQLYRSRLQCELSDAVGKSEAMFDIQGDIWFDIVDCFIVLYSQSGTPVFVPCGGTSLFMGIYNTTLRAHDQGGGTITMFQNCANASGYIENFDIITTGATAHDIGVFSAYYSNGRPKLIGPTAPTSPPTGMEWVDTTPAAPSHKMRNNAAAWV